MQKEYDIMVVGPISLDHNIDYLGNERREVGGAVVASGFAAAGSGAKPRFSASPTLRMPMSRSASPGFMQICTGQSPRPPVPSAINISPPTRKSGPAPPWACAILFALTSCRR